MLLKFLRIRFQVHGFLLMLVKDTALRACKAQTFSHYFCRTTVAAVQDLPTLQTNTLSFFKGPVL